MTRPGGSGDGQAEGVTAPAIERSVARRDGDRSSPRRAARTITPPSVSTRSMSTGGAMAVTLARSRATRAVESTVQPPKLMPASATSRPSACNPRTSDQVSSTACRNTPSM